MNVSDLGEFGLIQRLAKHIGAEQPECLIGGIGDDAAAWRVDDRVLLATTDTLVAGVHFLADRAPWCDVGWKALAVNVSDIVAMGGQPQFALVTLALPPDTDLSAVDQLYSGLAACAKEYGVTIVGGDTVSSPVFSVTVALLGSAETQDGRPLLLRRDGARHSDVIAVTGTLGDSAAGLLRLKEGAPPEDPLVRRHLHPQPPLAAAQEAARLGIECGIDVSDGLLQDIGHICEMSNAGAQLRADSIPLSDDLRAAYPDQALEFACTGGEDYQLVLTGERERIRRLAAASRVRVTEIGQMLPSTEPRVRLLDSSGNLLTFDTAGWDHFRPA